MDQVTQAQQMVDKYLEAEAAVLDGRSVTMNGRSLTMESLAEIRSGRDYWERRLAAAQSAAAGRSAGHSLAVF